MRLQRRTRSIENWWWLQQEELITMIPGSCVVSSSNAATLPIFRGENRLSRLHINDLVRTAPTNGWCCLRVEKGLHSLFQIEWHLSHWNDDGSFWPELIWSSFNHSRRSPRMPIKSYCIYQCTAQPSKSPMEQYQPSCLFQLQVFTLTQLLKLLLLLLCSWCCC